MDPSLDRATAEIGSLSSSVRALRAEVVQAEVLRARKIRVISVAVVMLVPAVALLVLLAANNFIILSRLNDTASDVRSTNSLLYGCFQPNTTCSTEGAKMDAIRQSQIQQTQFVIAVCQRQNPVDKDPAGTAMVACIQTYFPNFHLPARAGK